jgi:hypothetical protein
MVVLATAKRNRHPATGEHQWGRFILAIPAIIFIFPPEIGAWGDRA